MCVCIITAVVVLVSQNSFHALDSIAGNEEISSQNDSPLLVPEVIESDGTNLSSEKDVQDRIFGPSCISSSLESALNSLMTTIRQFDTISFEVSMTCSRFRRFFIFFSRYESVISGFSRRGFESV